MSNYYFKLTKVMNEISRDIMCNIPNMETKLSLFHEFDEIVFPLYKFLTTLEKAKEKIEDDKKADTKEKIEPESYITLPDVVLNTKLQKNGLTIQKSYDYIKSLTFLSNEYKDIINDFIHVYAQTLLPVFIIIDGKCLTTSVTKNNIIFGKFKFGHITVKYT